MLHQAKIISWPFVCTLFNNKQTISHVNTYDGNTSFDVTFSIANTKWKEIMWYVRQA